MSTTTFEQLTRAGQTRRLRVLAERALADYDLEVARVTRMSEGWNAAFRVESIPGKRGTGELFLLRVHRVGGPTTTEIAGELSWLAALRRDTGLQVPEPVPTRSGDLLTVVAVPGVPEPRTCDLLRWIDGRFHEAGLTPAHLRAVGVLTGRLQEHGRGMPPLPRPRVDTVTDFARTQSDNLSDEVIEHAADLVAGVHSADGGPVVRTVLEMTREARDELAQSPGTEGLIHGDLHQENYLFTPSGIATIDFDDCGVAPYVYDLAVTLSEVRHLGQREPALRAALLAGYREVRPLSDAHERLIDRYVAYRFLQLMMYQVEHRDEPMFRADWAENATDILGLLRRLAGLSG